MDLKNSWESLQQRLVTLSFGGSSHRLFLAELGRRLLEIHSKLQEILGLLNVVMVGTVQRREVTGRWSYVRQLLWLLEDQNFKHTYKYI